MRLLSLLESQSKFFLGRHVLIRVYIIMIKCTMKIQESVLCRMIQGNSTKEGTKKRKLRYYYKMVEQSY